MGANAVTTVPVYVAGEVLTAADLNITNSGIPVFASSVERDAAFGGTGEKVLAEGQYAYLEDTNATQYYDGAAWQPVSFTSTYAVFNETQASGTNGGSSVTGSFIKRTLNTTVQNDIVGCSIASSVITLPAGTYYVVGSSTFFGALYIKVKLRNTTDSTDTIISQNQYAPVGVGLAPVFQGLFTIAASKNFEVQYSCSSAVATTGLGINTSLGVSEIFTQIGITKVA